MKPEHRRGTYHVDARNVRAAADANPLTLCWSCERPLQAHPAHPNGKPAKWTAGHTVRSSHTARPWLAPCVSPTTCAEIRAGDWLAAQASTCNYADQPNDPNTVVTTRRW